MPGRVGLEPAGAVAEAAVGVGEGADLPFSLRSQTRTDGDGLRDLLAVGADVLDRGGADRAGDAGERLDADPAGVDGAGDEVVPGLARRDGDHHAAAGRVAVLDVGADAAGGDPDDGAGEAVVGDDQVAAAAAGRAAARPRRPRPRRPRPARPPWSRGDRSGRAGPPRRSVVWSRSRSGTEDGLGRRRAPSRRSQVTVSATVVQAVVAALDLAGHLDVDAALGGHDDRVGELAAEADHLGLGEPLRRRPGRPAPSCTSRARSRPGARRCCATCSSWWIGFWSPLALAYATRSARVIV